MKTAFITGITGQDGSYLAEFLLKKKYKVVGLVSKKHNIGWENVENLKKRVTFEDGDLLDKSSLEKVFKKYKISEVYNLAALSFIPACWEKPQLAFDINALGVLRLLEIIRDKSKKTRFYQASTSKIFGRSDKSSLNEKTPILPKDPYSVSKAAAHFIVRAFRNQYSLFAVNGILFNHESPKRGPDFVTRKITLSAASIKLGLQKKLELGNLKSKEDWGYAPDYVRAMWLMLQQDKPQDFVIGTGEIHSAKEFAEEAFKTIDLNWKDYVEIDKKFLRPAEVDCLKANSAKAKKILKWEPSVDFKKLVKIMVEADLKLEAANGK